MNDRALIAQIATGDKGAFESFYRRYEQRLWGYLMSIVREQALAEELVVDVMLAVWQGAGRFRGASKVSTWVLGIARNKALNVFRRQPPPVDPLEDAETGLEAENTDPLARMQEKEKAQHVRQALETLSLEHREVLELTFFQGFSYQEIGELVGCPVNTVKTRAYYARRQLKQALDSLSQEEQS
jgi:RNA polymerase sigma-70 factor (ECF subfamily)